MNDSTSLTVVQSPLPADSEPWKAFCSHCGAVPGQETPTASRVCADCGMGLVLSAPPKAAPAAGDAFLVVTSSLLVGAVSQVAERFLDVEEGEAVHRPVTELLASAEAEPGRMDLVTMIVRAAAGDLDCRRAVVRPAATFGVRCRARIGPCGPPSAALLVLDA